MRIVISSGHGKYVRGASGLLDEVDEARRVVNQVADLLRAAKVEVKVFHDDTSTSQNQNLNTIVNYHNAQTRDLDVSVHFNAYENTNKLMGTECLYLTQEGLAAKVSAAIAVASNLPDRGPKFRDNLFFLNSTKMPAILIEVCFVDSVADEEQYNMFFSDICTAIAETIAGIDLDDEDEVPVPPPFVPVPPLSEENRVIISTAVSGNLAIQVNGQVVHVPDKGPYATFRAEIELVGDVVLTINGQDFKNLKPSIPENQTGIIATVFGGTDDPQTSAYDPNKWLDDSELYVALPDKFEVPDRPRVRVYNRATGLVAEAEIWDVGPWNIDDPYWASGTRPQAEYGIDTTGRETNGAGIDLSPALARAIGIDGLGEVDWEFA